MKKAGKGIFSMKAKIVVVLAFLSLGLMLTVISQQKSLFAANPGEKVWEFLPSDPVFINPCFSSPAISGGFVYVGNSNRKLYSLNSTTGQKVWEFVAGDEISSSSPVVSGGYVYVGCKDKKIYCINASTGAKVWEFVTGDAVYSSPAVSGGFVYVGGYDTKFYCLNATTGAKVWEFAIASGFGSSPAVSGGYVYVGGIGVDTKIYCLNATTGAKVWDYATGGDIHSSPAVSGGMVYVGSADNKVYCLNATTGAKVWDYTTGDEVDASPAIYGGFVYVGSLDGKLYCLSATTGTKIWDYVISDLISFSPAVSGGFVYAGGTKLYCLNATTGVKAWEYTLGDYGSSPAVSGGYVYLGSNDRKFYCLKAANGDTGEWPMFRHDPEHTGVNPNPIPGGGALAITTTKLAEGKISDFYKTTLAASGGKTPYTWSVTGLPDGLSVNGSAEVDQINGYPSTVITKTVTVKVKDADNTEVTKDLEIIIHDSSWIAPTPTPTPSPTPNGSPTPTPPPGALAITTATLPSGYIGNMYTFELQATGGVGLLTWDKSVGALPDGVTLDRDGRIAGIPTKVGSFSFKAHVVDSSQPAQEAISVTYFIVIYEKVTKLTVEPDVKTLVIGEKFQFTAHPESTAGYRWSSSLKRVATIDQNGIAMAIGEGTTTISCYDMSNGDTATATLTVAVGDTSTNSAFFPVLAADEIDWQGFVMLVNQTNEMGYARLTGYQFWNGQEIGSSAFLGVPKKSKKLIRISGPDLVSNGTFGNKLPVGGFIAVKVDFSGVPLHCMAVMQSIAVDSFGETVVLPAVSNQRDTIGSHFVDLAGNYKFNLVLLNAVSQDNVFNIDLSDELGNKVASRALGFGPQSAKMLDVGGAFPEYRGRGWITTFSTSRVIGAMMIENLNSQTQMMVVSPFYNESYMTVHLPLALNMSNFWRSTLMMVNMGTGQATTQLNAYTLGGEPVGDAVSVSLWPGETRVVPLSSNLFHVLMTENFYSIRVGMDSPNVSVQNFIKGTGLINKGDLVVVNAQATDTPLLVAPHVVSNADNESFISVTNTTGRDMTVTFNFFAEDGVLKESRNHILTANETRVESATFFVPSIANTSGWIELIGTEPIAGEIYIHNLKKDGWSAFPLSPVR